MSRRPREASTARNLATEVDQLRRRNALLHDQLRDAQALQSTSVRALVAEFPAIRTLLVALSRAIDLADPLASSPLDGNPPNSTTHSDPTHTATINHTGDRNRIRRWNKRLDQVAADMLTEVTAGNPTASELAPRCRRRNCADYGRRQPHGTTACRTCGEPIVRPSVTAPIAQETPGSDPGR